MNTDRTASWVIGDIVIHPAPKHLGIEQWLANVREKMPQWEEAFKLREREMKHGIKWKQMTQALVIKIYTRLDEMEVKSDSERELV